MKLLTSELKQFKANSAFVKTSTIIPILSYLKIEPGKITKNGLSSFCTQDITYVGESFLIEETVLMNAIDAAGSEIEVSIKGMTITLSSNGMNWKCQSQKVSEFIKTPDNDGKGVILTSDILSQIAIACNFVDEDHPQQAATMVFIDENIIAASNGFIGYAYKTKTGVNKIFIPKTTCLAIKHFESLQFSETEKHQFFSANGIEYGFIKPEAKFVDISSFFSFTADGKFEIEKSEIVSFNNQAIKTAVSKVSTTLFSISLGSLSMSMSDVGYEREVTKSIHVTGGTDGSFRYNPELLNRLLKAIPENKIVVHQTANRYYVTSGENTISLILKIENL